MATIVSRLFLVLSLALFGAFQTGFDRVAINTSPTALSDSASLSVILTAQNHLLRAHLPNDDSPDYALPASVRIGPDDAVIIAVFGGREIHRSSFAVYILPPARGPPVV